MSTDINGSVIDKSIGISDDANCIWIQNLKTKKGHESSTPSYALVRKKEEKNNNISSDWPSYYKLHYNFFFSSFIKTIIACWRIVCFLNPDLSEIVPIYTAMPRNRHSSKSVGACGMKHHVMIVISQIMYLIVFI